ncbi:MAG TPA: ABC transporter substrate-binding protein [Gammaproteobacteria bacterium]
MGSPRRRAIVVIGRICATLVVGTFALLGLPADAADRPSVASINLCADQLVLGVADPEQILTLSWLSADPDESMLAARAARFPLNYGSAEEILRYDPDVVIGGAFTNSFTRALLRDVGYDVVAIEPPSTFEEIERNVRRVAQAIGRAERGETVIAEMRAQLARLRRTLPARTVDAVVVRPGGFTVAAGTLAEEMMTLAGLRNVSAERGLDRWGSLSMETLLNADPELLIFTNYRLGQPSLANAVLAHPALDALRARVTTATVPASQWSCGLPQILDAVETMRRAATAAAARSERENGKAFRGRAISFADGLAEQSRAE